MRGAAIAANIAGVSTPKTGVARMPSDLINRRSFAALGASFAAAGLLPMPKGHAAASDIVRIVHSGNSPSRKSGVIYVVKSNGDLHWYRYMGDGANDVTGATGWHPNSGNRIGNGWQSMVEIMGYGDGVLLAIHENGDLLWYKYDGDGVDDVSGAAGWHANSGNPIGNGWTGFHRVFATPRGPGSQGNVFVVKENGDLHWYSYSGNGEADRSGAMGWHPNSQNPVGNGWSGLRDLVGCDRGRIFAVRDNGDLLWYQYNGSGIADLSGATGWSPNSSNPIGNGWNFRALLAGPRLDASGFDAALYAIGQDGDMRWYAYGGQGESDVSGGTGWHPSSSNFIGRGW
jgi:Tachylectin